ncbi:hypothetical protein ACIRBX_19435 [Kitasatospora sp. NPDC096147]|uniref:hypothetical protein n=1 Tax=Kitasatospora sp. NPDC096147 TaxID=3364093 RepID=UPI00381AB222
MTQLQTQSDRTRELIPGVVDGSVSVSADAEGNVSVHVLVGGYGRQSDRCDRIEFVLSGEHARSLGAVLAAGRPEQAAPVPCSVGVQLNAPAR